VDTELEALQTSAAHVWELVLDDVCAPSSLLASFFMVAESLEDRIDTVATNGVC
jgi:hypothetical protein